MSDIRAFAYGRTVGFVAQDESFDITELRAELLPMQIAIGVKVTVDRADQWTIEVLLPFVTVTLSKNEVPF